MKLSAFALLIIMLLSSCSETIQTISPTSEPSETGLAETTSLETEQATPTPTLSATPTAEPTPPKKEKITRKDLKKFMLLEYNVDRTYEKVVALFGVEGYRIGEESYYPEYQWELDTGEFLYVKILTDNSGKKSFEYLGYCEIKSYSVKDTPNFFKSGISVPYEDCQKIKKGMSCQEVVGILGEAHYKREIPSSGETIFEWDIDNGQYIVCYWKDGKEDAEVTSCDIRDYTVKTREDIAKQLFDD